MVVNWDLEEREDRPELLLNWTEAGGPAVAMPDRKGFGSKLISTGLVGSGGVELDFKPAGLNASFRAPLDQVELS